MNAVIFAETLRRGWRTALYWSIGLAAYAAYVLLIFGGDADARAQMADLLATKMPGFLGAMFGIPDDAAFLMTNEGFYSFTYFTYVSLMVAVWAVLAGLSITANDEDSGVMNMLLALPVPRWRVVAERIGAQLVLLVLILFGGFAGTVAVMQALPAMQIDLGRVAAGNVGLWLLIGAIVCVTALLSVLFRRRSTAGAVAGVFVAASFLLNTLAGSTQSDVGLAMQQASLFYHFDSADILQNGLSFGAVGVLAAVSVGVVWLTAQRFGRRDIGG
jgi:ABC-2 type transport system permease protein